MGSSTPRAPGSAEDHRTARELAHAAGDLLLSIRRQGLRGPALGRQGDVAAHDFLTASIRSAYPDDSILSEEAIDDPRRLSSRRVWIIDPLDGTREYTEPARTDWSVHVALWEDGEIRAAAIALPARNLVLCSAVPPVVPERQDRNEPTILVSRTRPPELASRVASAIGAKCVPMGSAGAKTASVILGEADAYLHAGGQYQWDSAAPAAVALRAGLHASRLSGEPLAYNGYDVSVPDLVVCRRELAPVLLAAMAEARAP